MAQNFQTHSMALYLKNDRIHSSRWAELAKVMAFNSDNAPQVREGIWTREQYARFGLADAIKSQIVMDTEWEMGKTTSLLVQTLTQAGLDGINWDDIAREFMVDLAYPKR